MSTAISVNEGLPNRLLTKDELRRVFENQGTSIADVADLIEAAEAGNDILVMEISPAHNDLARGCERAEAVCTTTELLMEAKADMEAAERGGPDPVQI